MSTTTVTKPPTTPDLLASLRAQLIGIDAEVPLLDGRRVPYVNFDNAASTPTFRPIADKVDEFLNWYSNVHRGTGFKSQLSSWAFEQSRDRIAAFLKSDLTQDVVIFTKNTTEAINKLAARLPLGPDDVVLTSLMEHHSNELPWRRVGQVVHICLNDDGTLSMSDLEAKLLEHGSRVKVVAITGASNVTGYINDIHAIARRAHAIGADLLVDAAQLAPHRPIDMCPPQDPDHIDYLVLSAHKMYAPYGVGILVGKRSIFEHGDPDVVGGGAVDIVNLEEAYWTDLPDKEEAGTPDIVGVVALAKAIDLIESVGWEAVITHESKMTEHALRLLSAIDGVDLHGDTDPNRATERLGVISFSVRDVPHGLVGAILNYEHGIGVRNGCFCAHTYVKCLLNVPDDVAKKMEREILARDRTHLPGTVRASFGLYNSLDEIDRLGEALSAIAAGRIDGDYVLDKESGDYRPRDYDPNFEEFFRL